MTAYIELQFILGVNGFNYGVLLLGFLLIIQINFFNLFINIKNILQKNK